MTTFLNTKPYRAVPFVESAVKKALDNAGYLIADCKYDGVRGNICVDNTAVGSWLSRVAKPIPALEYLNGFDARWQSLLKDDRWIFPDGFMLDGELMVKGVDFNTGSGLLRTKWLKPTNCQFDIGGVPPLKGSKVDFSLDTKHLSVCLYAILPLHIVESGEDYDVMNLLMQEHVKAAVSVLKDHFPEINWLVAKTYEVYDMVELQALYEKVRSEGNEGLIVKDPTDIYRRGKKSGWWKLKPLEEADGTVVGLVWGTEGKANEDKVIGFEVLLESGRVVSATNISQVLMDEFTESVRTATPCDERDASNYNPYDGWQCQITYTEETPDGSLRHPSWKMWRGTEADPTVKM